MCKKLKTTITLAPHIKEFATKEANSLGLDFSAYITVLIAEKMRGNILSTPTKTATDNSPVEKDAGSKENITINSAQENEIDRLLQM